MFANEVVRVLVCERFFVSVVWVTPGEPHALSVPLSAACCSTALLTLWLPVAWRFPFCLHLASVAS